MKSNERLIFSMGVIKIFSYKLQNTYVFAIHLKILSDFSWASFFLTMSLYICLYLSFAKMKFILKFKTHFLVVPFLYTLIKYLSICTKNYKINSIKCLFYLHRLIFFILSNRSYILCSSFYIQNFLIIILFHHMALIFYSYTRTYVEVQSKELSCQGVHG